MTPSPPEARPLTEKAEDMAKFIRERWNPENKVAPLGIAALLDDLVVELRELQEIATLARQLMPANPRPGSKTERLCELLAASSEEPGYPGTGGAFEPPAVPM